MAQSEIAQADMAQPEIAQADMAQAGGYGEPCPDHLVREENGYGKEELTEAINVVLSLTSLG